MSLKKLYIIKKVFHIRSDNWFELRMQLYMLIFALQFEFVSLQFVYAFNLKFKFRL
jgi:hypothetical protein